MCLGEVCDRYVLACPTPLSSQSLHIAYFLWYNLRGYAIMMSTRGGGLDWYDDIYKRYSS